jgi:hypothetical protein
MAYFYTTSGEVTALPFARPAFFDPAEAEAILLRGVVLSHMLH